MAETFLAVRRGPGGFEQHVCVKRILPFYESDPTFVADFLEEARLAAQLRHANITQVVDFGAVEGSHYLALEFVDGMDLRALLARLRERGQRLEVRLAILVAIELATALEFAHTPGRGRQAVVHRDISPSNVLISRAGAVYLTDFGIARAVGTKRRTESGVLRGKVPYVAPEYAAHGHFDGRTDLFGLGVVLFEALTGRRPFDGETDLDTLQRIKEGHRPQLGFLVPGAPPPLVAAVEKLLEIDPRRRHASAGELIDALSAVSPPATATRELGALVASLSPPLTDSLRISAAQRTAVIANAPAPAYPSVREASPHAATLTSDVGGGTFKDEWLVTNPSRPPPEAGWASTDPSQISHHDRPSPYAPVRGGSGVAEAVLAPSRSESLPSTRPRLAVPDANVVAGVEAAARQPLGAMDIRIVPTPTPSSRPSLSAPEARRGPLLVLIAVLGLVAFAAATAGTYAIVQALFGG